MMLKLRYLLVALLILWSGHPVWAMDGKATWTRVQSDHFLFIGDAGEKEIRQVAQKMEQFREALVRIFGDAVAREPVPTIVFVFANDCSFTPYKPLFHGQAMEVEGYFQPDERTNYIAIVPSPDVDDSRVMFHEYAHLLVNNLAGNVPVWLNEGLAGFLETFEARADGRVVFIGRPAAANMDALHGTMMPLTGLMGIERSSPVYNEGQRRGVFYAQSWALVHYLLSNPARAGQLSTYLTQVRAGGDLRAVFTSVFKTDPAKLGDQLRTYVHRFTFPVTQFTFVEPIGRGGVQAGSRMSELEARTYLAEMLGTMGRVDQARKQLRQLLAAEPDDARALSALGTIELRAGHADMAMPLLERAAALAPDDGWTQGALGRALGDRLRRMRSEAGHEDRLARARAVLTRALALSPRSAHALFQLALVELEAGADRVHARSLIEMAWRLAPAREHYSRLLARVLMNEGERERALVLQEAGSPIDALTALRAADPGRPRRTTGGEAVSVELTPTGSRSQ